MTDQEKAARMQAEMEERIRLGALGIRAEFDACPVMGEAFKYVVEECFLPMPDV